MIGSTVSHYRITEKLGRGGMAVVYRAHDTALDRDVALKFLAPELADDERARKRFLGEARAASKLRHKHICTIHEIGEAPDGQPFICMDLYEGETLADRIARGPLPLGEAVRVVAQIGSGLGAAHAQGITHRDIKPGNIVLTDGDAVILDFGLAHVLGSTRVTKTGATVGTVSYMSPEAAQGTDTDARSDIWSLAVLAWEAMTGRRPFDAEHDVAALYRIVNEAPGPVPPDAPEIPDAVLEVLRRALEKEPGARYPTVEAFITALAEAAGMELPAPVAFGSTPSHADASKRKRSAPGSRRTLRVGAWVLGIVAVAAAGIGVFSHYRTPPDPPHVSERTMLVVLPFENMGSPDDDYFAAGITEEITSRLASIQRLGVISRKSAVLYAGTDMTAKQIGSELGVEYVVEGTIRWARSAEAPSRVRITPELVRVADDTRLWSKAYDRVIEDVFEIQSDIANKVVEQLGLTLFEGERSAVDAQPTRNLDAYHAYLRGRYYTGQPHFTVDNWERAIRSYNRAVELDPGFVLAYAKLSEAHSRLYYYRVDLSDERRNMARSAMDEALRLDPDQPEARLARGYYYLMVERDVEQALEEFAIAEQVLPESAEVLEARADSYRQRGDWLEAFDLYEQACRLSPRNTSPFVEIAITGWLCRQYPRAVEAANQAISIAPDQNWPYLIKGVTYWSWHGASEEARSAFEVVPSDHGWSPWVWYWQMVYEGEYREALGYLSSIPVDWIRIKTDGKPRVLYEAYVHEALDQPELALAAYQAARTLLEAEVNAYPEDPRYHSSLGVACAALGQTEDAIREGERAVELLPVSADAVYGTPYVTDLAHIYTLLGDHASALAVIEELLAAPSMISVPLLEVDPRWNRLRDDPGFQRLLEEYATAD